MGYPKGWLKEMISAEEFDEWCLYHQHYPLDDQSNHHYPVAQLEATLINLNRAQGVESVSLFDRLIFGKKEQDIEQLLAEGNW